MFITSLIIIGVFTVAAELLLWIVFRRKVSNITFPHHVDESYFRFFSIMRIRIIAILHTAFLLAFIILTAILLW